MRFSGKNLFGRFYRAKKSKNESKWSFPSFMENWCSKLFWFLRKITVAELLKVDVNDFLGEKFCFEVFWANRSFTNPQYASVYYFLLKSQQYKCLKLYQMIEKILYCLVHNYIFIVNNKLTLRIFQLLTLSK